MGSKDQKERLFVINWLVENDAKYGMQRRPRRYKGTRLKELEEEIATRKELESPSWNTLYKKPNK